MPFKRHQYEAKIPQFRLPCDQPLRRHAHLSIYLVYLKISKMDSYNLCMMKNNFFVIFGTY